MITGGLFYHIFTVPYDQNTMKILSNAFNDILLKNNLLMSYDFGSVKVTIRKFIWLHGFNILVHVIFMIGHLSIG